MKNLQRDVSAVLMKKIFKPKTFPTVRFLPHLFCPFSGYSFLVVFFLAIKHFLKGEIIYLTCFVLTIDYVGPDPLAQHRLP
jgi:hypothetical protein